MSEQTAVKTREKWVDDVKVIACILVVLGHFFQSMTKANILPENDLSPSPKNGHKTGGKS